MRFQKVETIAELPIENEYYDLAIFASGFEERSIYVASLMEKKVAKKIAILGYESEGNILSRPSNDKYFSSRYETEISNRSGVNDDQFLFDLLDELSTKDEHIPLRILIDYSVMTRTWYGAILTWARFLIANRSIEIDFIYACGSYETAFGPLSISEIISLPGFEGISGGFRRTTAFFGLGYDKYATLAVYDRLEPDSVYCCIAQRKPDDENAKRVLAENEVLIDAAGTKVIRLPLTDVPGAFGILSDQILGLERTTHIVMIPMGPKPHVLVTLLAALRMPWLTCLHAKGSRSLPIQVKANGQISLARVFFS